MKIIVRGVYIAPKIELLPDEESVLQLYEEIRDKAPFMRKYGFIFAAIESCLIRLMRRTTQASAA